jgi:hypothetical protein
MPPPIIISVAFPKDFQVSISYQKLLPAMIAVKGFSELCNTFSALFTSPSISKPNILLSAGKILQLQQ